MNQEVWKTINSFQKCEISNFGNLRNKMMSLWKIIENKWLQMKKMKKSLEKELEGRCRWLHKQKKPKVGLKF